MKDQQSIFIEIRQVMAELFELDESEVTMESTLYDELDLDSIDAVELVVKLQNMTGKKISPEDFKSVRTVADVVTAVEQLIAE